MELSVFFTTFGIIFLAELGDKTQLTVMALSVRYPWKKIIIGICGAFILLNLGAVFIGKMLVESIPEFYIKLFSGSLFLFFGISTLRSKTENAQESSKNESKGPVLSAFLLILTAELGDKTQLVTCGLTAQYGLPVIVFFASTAALLTVSLLGIFLGKQISRFIPANYIQKGAGCVFLLFSIVIFYSCLRAV